MVTVKPSLQNQVEAQTWPTGAVSRPLPSTDGMSGSQGPSLRERSEGEVYQQSCYLCEGEGTGDGRSLLCSRDGPAPSSTSSHAQSLSCRGLGLSGFHSAHLEAARKGRRAREWGREQVGL